MSQSPNKSKAERDEISPSSMKASSELMHMNKKRFEGTGKLLYLDENNMAKLKMAENFSNSDLY